MLPEQPVPMALSPDEFATSVLRTVVAKLGVLSGTRQAQSMALNVVTDVVKRCTPCARLLCAQLVGSRRRSRAVSMHVQTSRQLVKRRMTLQNERVRAQAAAARCVWQRRHPACSHRVSLAGRTVVGEHDILEALKAMVRAVSHPRVACRTSER